MGQDNVTWDIVKIVVPRIFAGYIIRLDDPQIKFEKLLDYLKVTVLGIGMVLYYTPWGDRVPSLIGIVLTVIASAGCAMNIAINRHMLLNRGVDRLELTTKPMLCGGLVMLVLGLMTEQMPALTAQLAGIIAYLAFVSGALGFSLWIWSQQWLSALESGSLNSLMLIETAALDAIVFGRVLTSQKSIAIVLVFVAVVLIQMKHLSGFGNRKRRAIRLEHQAKLMLSSSSHDEQGMKLSGRRET